MWGEICYMGYIWIVAFGWEGIDGILRVGSGLARDLFLHFRGVYE